MSVKGDALRLQGRLGTKLDKRETKPQRFRAIMGDGAGTVKVAGKPNYVYIRRLGRGRIEECLNNKAPARDGLLIIAGYSHESPDLLQVLEVDWASFAEPGQYAYTTFHHESHEFRNAYGGDDVVWVQKQQVLPLLARPTSPPTMRVVIMADWYPWGTGWHYFEETLSADLTAQIPVLPNQARYVLITIDGATEALQYTIGVLFSTLLPPPATETMIPTPPLGSIPVVGVYLTGVTTAIDWESLYDLRLFNQPVGGSVSPGPHALLDSVVHSDTVTNTPPAQGSITVANATPEWDELVIGTAHQLLKVNAGGTDPAWASFDWDEISAAAAADMVHDHSAAGEGGEIPLASLGSYAQGAIVRGGAADWEAHAAETNHFILVGDGVDITSKAFDWDDMAAGAGADMVHDHTGPAEGGLIILGLPAVAGAGYVIVSDGVNSWVVDQTPLWTGKHSFEAGIAFVGASDANEITVPDNTAIALELLDAGGLEYMRIVSTDANPYFLIDPGAAGINVAIGAAAPVAGVKLDVRGVINVPAGTGIWFGDANTEQIYETGNSIRIRTAGVDRVIVLDDGKVGIGCIPTSRFHVEHATAGEWAAHIKHTDTGGIAYGLKVELTDDDAADIAFGIIAAADWKMIVLGDGSTGFGRSPPDARVHIYHAVAASNDNLVLRLQNPTTAADVRVGIAFAINTHVGANWDGFAIQAINDGVSTGDLGFYSVIDNALTLEMYIDSSVGVSIASLGGGGNQDVGADNNGLLYVPFVSDRKFKDNIKPLTGGLEAVLALRGVTYDWNPNALAEVGLDFGKCGLQVGLVAQEVTEALPLAAVHGKRYESFDNRKVTPYLIEAIKEIDTRLTKLEVAQ